MKVVDEPITPPTAADGPAREERVTPPREPNLLGAVLLDRLFGLDPAALAHACEASIFSPRTRMALRAKHGAILRAHAHYPDHLATSLEDVFRFYTGMSFARAAEAIQARVAEVVQTTTQFGAGLGNTINRQLLTAYAASQYFEESISRSSIVRDFRPIRVVGQITAPDLLPVAENAAYTESAALSTVVTTGPVQKYGIIETITLEALRNDDIGLIRQRVEDYARTARRQRAAAIWALWTSNAVYAGDGVAWFNAAHANTGTGALTEASLKAAVMQLINQTRPGSTQRLGFPPRYPNLWLMVPPELMDLAYGLNKSRGGTGADSNWPAGLFGLNNEHIIVNPGLTDATDWGVFWDASLIESIRVAHLDQEEPQVIVARDETQGQMFTHDRIQYKIFMAFAAVLVDYRGAAKNIVA